MSAVPMTTSAAANPFGAPAAAPASNAIAASNQQREIAEIQGAIAIAKRFPRDERAAVDRILQACTRPGLADGATYTYSRGGADVTGPSIRLAEAIAQAWGNFQFGVRELEQRDGESTVEAYAWDVESNTRQVKVFQVAHERHTRQGVKRLTDPRDVYELVANQGARRLRACILGLIPGDVIDAAVAQCDATLRTKADVTPERIAKLLESFAAYGVTRAHIEKRLQRDIGAMTPAQLVQLGKVFNSLRDGMSKPDEWFDIEPAQPSAISEINGQVRQQQAGRKASAPPALAAPTFAAVEEMLRKARGVADLDAAVTAALQVPDAEQRDELLAMAEVRRHEMSAPD